MSVQLCATQELFFGAGWLVRVVIGWCGRGAGAVGVLFLNCGLLLWVRPSALQLEPDPLVSSKTLHELAPQKPWLVAGLLAGVYASDSPSVGATLSHHRCQAAPPPRFCVLQRRTASILLAPRSISASLVAEAPFSLNVLCQRPSDSMKTHWWHEVRLASPSSDQKWRKSEKNSLHSNSHINNFQPSQTSTSTVYHTKQMQVAHVAIHLPCLPCHCGFQDIRGAAPLER